jgi:hypothetical protein
MAGGERTAREGIGDAVPAGTIPTRESGIGSCSSKSTGRGERRVELEGASRREGTPAEIEDALLGRVEVGVDSSEPS